MALSATFTANFASFYDAVDKAETKLKDFSAGADKVGGRLTALGNSFSGVKLIQDATLMVKAVEDIGGASKLTEKELARLGATTNEAVAKMKALGMEVPKSLQQIADQTKGATKATKDWAGSLTTVAGSFTAIAGAVGAGFGISQVISFGKAIVADAGHIADLSAKLGISAEAVQRFGYAASQTGASMDVIGSAIGKMNVTLASGDKSTVAALDAIGLQFRDIRAMKPEDAFTAIAQAIQRIPDPMAQAEAAVKLFSKTGMELLPAINANLIEIGNNAKVMSDHTVEELDKAGDEWGRFVDNLKVSTAEFMVWAKENARKYAFGAAGFVAQEAAGLVKNTSEVVYGQGKIIADAATSLAANLAKVPDPLAKIGLAAKSTTGLLGDYGVAQDQAKDKADALAATQKKAAEAAAAHLAKIQDLAAALSGTGLTQKTKDLTEAVALSALQFGRATLNSQATVDAVHALAKEGAALTPILLKIYLAHLDWAAAGVKVKVGLRDLLDDLPNYTQQLKNFMSVQFFNFKLPDFKTQIGSLFENLPNLAPQLRAWGKQNIEDPMRASAAAAAEATATELSIVGAAFDALGQHGGAAFQAVTQMVEIAIKGLIAYRAATEAAQKATIALSVATGVATLGIGLVVGQVLTVMAQDAAAARRAAATLKELQDAIIAFGETPTTVPAIVDSWLGPEKSLHKALMDQLAELQKVADARAKALDGARTDVGKLQSALAVFGGVVPAALRPAIAAILAIPGIPPDLAQSLGALAKDPNWQTIEQRAKDLGITLDGMGKSFQQSKFGETALGFVRDLHMFEDSGADMQIVIEGMSDELSDLYNNAQKYGIKLPNTLKPYMQTLVEQGRLLDENGNKIDHLNEDSFADIEDKGLTDVVKILEEIAQLLRDGLPKAADAGAKGVKEAFEKHPVVIPVEWQYPGAPAPPPGAGPGSPDNPGIPPPGGPGRQPGPGMESYQRGTPGFVNFGRETPVLLHGWEAVVPRGQALASSAPIDITVISQLDGREVARNQVRYIPRALVNAGL